MSPFKDRYKREMVEVFCPIHKISRIIYIPEEKVPTCPVCKKQMVIKEVLTEGKY